MRLRAFCIAYLGVRSCLVLVLMMGLVQARRGATGDRAHLISQHSSQHPLRLLRNCLCPIVAPCRLLLLYLPCRPPAFARPPPLPPYYY